MQVECLGRQPVAKSKKNALQCISPAASAGRSAASHLLHQLVVVVHDEEGELREGIHEGGEEEGAENSGHPNVLLAQAWGREEGGEAGEREHGRWEETGWWGR